MMMGGPSDDDGRATPDLHHRREELAAGVKILHDVEGVSRVEHVHDVANVRVLDAQEELHFLSQHLRPSDLLLKYRLDDVASLVLPVRRFPHFAVLPSSKHFVVYHVVFVDVLENRRRAEFVKLHL